VLSNAALERMFSHKESKIDLFDLMNSGKIVFINTAKDLLGEEGTTIFGRFFIALIAQAAIQRSAIPAHKRNPAFVYIDEAADYFDSNISRIQTQVRKYRVGLTLAHQSLGQAPAELRDSIFSSTTIKFAGGVSAADANTVARELRTESDFLLAQRRTEKETHFACYVKNYTSKALSISVPLGFVESLPTISAEDADYLLATNRERYSAPAEPISDVEFSFKKPEAAAKPKKQAKQNKSEQKSAAESAPETEVQDAAASVPRIHEIPAPASGLLKSDETPPTDAISAPKRPSKTLAADGVPEIAGKGGREHKYLQHFIKGLAEERGFHAVIEEQVLVGTGQVDVSLIRGDLKIACEISVTTRKDHELGNVEKCIAAGYKHVLLVGLKEKQIKNYAKAIENNLAEAPAQRSSALHKKSLVEYLESFGPPPPHKRIIRGCTVITRLKGTPEERERLRKAVAAKAAMREQEPRGK
jgi:hypothetical protein